MRKILLTLFLSFSFYCIAQDKAIITYEETFTFEIPEEVRARMPKDMSTKNESKKILTISGKESYFKNAPEPVEMQQSGEQRGRGFMRRMGGEETYTNLTNNIQLSKAKAFDKEFIVADDPKRFKWRIIATEQRDVMGYTCIKAEYKDSTTLTTVWFAPQIPINAGPNGMCGLPGLILVASIGENRVLLAKEINLKADDVVIKPIESKNPMSRAEYTKMMKERMEEMRKMFQSRRPSGQ